MLVKESWATFSGERLNNFRVGLTNVSPNDTAPSNDSVVVCAQGPEVAGPNITVECARGLKPARYLVILNPNQVLTLCEVEVYGLPGEIHWRSKNSICIFSL